MKPNTILMVFIQDPERGALFSQLGNMAKSVKGSARARAKANMPTVGPTQLPLVAASTSSRPTMGAVQEKLTNTRVKAMRKIESNPVVVEALLSTLLPQEEGSVSSNHPKKLTANTTSNRKKNTLKTAFVASELSVSGPKTAVTTRANRRKMTMMETP